MIKSYYWIALLTLGVLAQEQSNKNEIAPTLLKCYTNAYLREKDNTLPHTLNTLIAIIRKIEDRENLNMDLRSLTVAILHKYRKDGILENPRVLKKPGVEPYIIDSLQSEKFSRILELIPERTNMLPYDIISDVETCSLHSMLSGSIELYERGDEGTVCKYAENANRNTRSVINNHYRSTNASADDDVETLTPEQIDVIKHQKNGDTESAFDPNALYPELPPNHPEVARIAKIEMPPKSRCPVENGVIKTPWGPVSAGSLISGIAAGLEPQIVRASDILFDKSPEEREKLSGILLDNRWFATVAGDLAVVAVRQGPTEQKISVGVNGNWNSTVPHWYFLNANEKLHFTTARIRGDLDGLILANQIESLYGKVPTLKLSQILDLYYSSHGLFNTLIRACNRRALFLEIARNSTMSEQAHNASFILKNLHEAVTTVEASKTFAVQATNEVIEYVQSSMNKDLSCDDINKGIYSDIIQITVDLTIILDTTWNFETIYPIIVNILDNININQYNSQFTLINGRDGSIMINTTSSILDIGSYNVTHYRNVTNTGFDFPRALEKLNDLQRKKLNDERNGFGHGKSDVVLFIPYTSTVANGDKEFCINELKKMREQVPDATVLILTYGSKDTWIDFVRNAETDLFIITTTSELQSTSIINSVISRIKQVPQRLINTQCGADYDSIGSSSTNSFIDYIQPGTIISYRLHPNYFFSTDSDHVSKVKIEGSGWGILNVCTSRIRVINTNSTDDVSCTSVNTNTHIIEVSCGNAEFIHRCEPLYISVMVNSSITNFQCKDTAVCRFSHMIKYTVSYEDLVCTSNANANVLNVIVLIASIIYISLYTL